MGLIRPIEVLIDVSYALVEPVVATQVNPTGAPISPGTVTVTPGSMVGIYLGAQLIVGYQTAGEEIVIVTAVTATTFTAGFVNNHLATDPLFSAVFSSGQPDHPLFTQSEMLGYFADVQNDFLMKVRPVYRTGTVPLLSQQRIYANPSDAIQIERIAVAGVELFNVAQTDLDGLDPGWQQSSVPPNPQYWYQDGINLSFGVAPVIQRNDTSELFYSQKAGTVAGLLDQLLVPDAMTFILKYGILARCWSKDGEQRDPTRGKFCQSFYDLFCLICSKFMNGVNGRIQSAEESVEPALASMKS